MEKVPEKDQLSEFHFFLNKLLQPKNWSLRIRLVYTTGAILVVGALLTLVSISYTLNQGAKEAIYHKLDDYEHLFVQQTKETITKNLTIASQLASTTNIKQAINNGIQTFLRDTVADISTNLRKTTGKPLPSTQFFGVNTAPLYHSMNINSLGDANRTSFEMVTMVEQDRLALSGVQFLQSGPVISSIVPVFYQDDFVGTIEINTEFHSIFDSLDLKGGYGLTILLDETISEQLATPKKFTKHQKKVVFNSLGAPNIKDFIGTKFSTNSAYTQKGNYFSKTLELRDFQGNLTGSFILFFDGTAILEKSKSTILAISLMTFLGVLFLSLSLYWNATRIRTFFKQMRKIIVASHSNDFSERFETDTVHCLDLLQCGHKECPIYQDPTRVCYLETGDEAISPKLRNSCIFLNKYDRCSNCPVYKSHHGDELTEMKHVINTMMRLWGDFLGSVGSLLSDVLRTESRNIPSLDGVSGYLTQMAGLTNYGHDLQGVYSEDEVYKQLEWVFEKEFGLIHFNLLKVNSAENTMTPVLERDSLTSGHLDVLFNCELCRCMRVAEDVVSYHNPHLCPYFEIDTTNQVKCCLPMVMGGRVGAVFTFAVEKAEWAQKKKDISIIKKYLDETAPILSSLSLLKASKEQALKDPLTKCHNRRFMDEYLAQFERMNNRTNRKIGFIMADLDHFKMVNDEFGHLAGDEVLKQLAEIIRQSVRASDVLIRYGGEEFLVMLMEIEKDGVSVDIAEKIRVAVEEAKITLPTGGTLRKTLSMGVAEYPADGDQLYQVIKYADVALYKAKSDGRNKVKRFTKEMWETEDY